MSKHEPWDYHADLTAERINNIASILASVRNHEVASTNSAHEVLWGMGCMIYDRTLAALKKYQITTSWFRCLPDEGKAIVGIIGVVPFKFFRGEPENPTNRTLAVRHSEIKQMSLAICDGDDSDVDLWRFAVDTDIDATTLDVHFVGYNRAGDVVSLFKCAPKTDLYDNIDSVENFPKPQAVKLELPRIDVKREQGRNNAEKSE